MSSSDTVRRTIILMFALFGLGAAACVSAVEDPFVPKYESKRLQIGTSFDDVLCLGAMELWESHVDEIEQMLGVSRDFAWLFVYRDDELEQITKDCDGDGGDIAKLTGCWRDPVARAILGIVPHELVHAWTATVQHRPLPALSEGLAVRMTGTVQHIGMQEFTVDDLLFFEPTAEHYPQAGHFVAWLLSTHGPETFMELYIRASRGMTQPQLSMIFLDVLDKTPEEILLTYQSSAKDYYPAMGAAACGRGPRISWHEDAATWPAEGSCLEGPFFGFETSNWWQRVTIEVPTSGPYLLDPAGRMAAMTRCLTVPADESELPEPQSLVNGDWLHYDPMDLSGATFDWEEPIELEVGVYEVWVERRSREVSSKGSPMSLFKL